MAQNVFLKEPAPTKVQLVNGEGELVEVEVKNLPFNSSGNGIVVQVVSGVLINQLRPSASRYNVFLDNILLLQGDGTFIPIPLCTMLTSVSQVDLDNTLASYKTAYATLVSGVTAATLHYSKMSSNGVTTSEVYNLKD